MHLDNFTTSERISGLTHGLYRYPATTSPALVRDLLLGLSEENDLVLDPFAGGGTTLVEAVGHNRRALGFDINPVACLVARTKTTPLSESAWRELSVWASEVSGHSGMADVVSSSEPRIRNCPRELVEFLSWAKSQMVSIGSLDGRRMAKCLLLNIARKQLETGSGIVDSPAVLAGRVCRDVEIARASMEQLEQLAMQFGLSKSNVKTRRSIVNADVEQISALETVGREVQLVLTSPPYPGVHVLYHRYQIQGRKESPLPYWIIDRRDGHGARHYTLGGRSKKGETEYFDRITSIYTSIRAVLSSKSLVIQLVGFSDRSRQLPMYMAAMNQAGYDTASLPGHGSGSIRRIVPNRRWHAANLVEADSSREELLVHVPRTTL